MAGAAKKEAGGLTFLPKAAVARTRGALPEAVNGTKPPPELPESVREAYDSLDRGEYAQVATTTSQGRAVGSIQSWVRAAEAAGLKDSFMVAMRSDGEVRSLWIGNDPAGVKARNERLTKAAKRRTQKSSQ